MKVHLPFQRIIAYTLLVVIIGVVGLLFVLPILSKHIAMDKEIALLREHRAKFYNIVLKKSSFAQQIEKVTRNNNNRHYLTSNKISLATAELTQLLGSIVAGNNAELISTSSDNNKNHMEIKEANKVQIKVDMRCNIASLKTMLFRIETGAPLLFIDDFQLQVLDIQQSERGQGVNNIRTKFTVFGFFLRVMGT